jgi:glycosyltransferase involved in cell wall biosynthesis
MVAPMSSISYARNPALIRVFVPTYRRPALLQRAIKSLCNQTFAAWVCEIHNDAPDDDFPTELVQSLGDERLMVHKHDRNLGGVETFNLFYRPVTEQFISLLEDDNWWDPHFLEAMLHEMGKYPNVLMAWCNQRVWEELPDGSWVDTGHSVNPPEKEPRLIEFGDERQIMGAAHANGAMLLRSVQGQDYSLPRNLPFNAMESFRERVIPHPLLYVPRPLAVFSKTLTTHRSRSNSEWTTVQTMLAATFLKYANYDRAKIEKFFENARTQKPPATNPLLLACLVDTACRRLCRYTRPVDWLHLLRALLRRPRTLAAAMLSKRRHADWWKLLDRHTSARFGSR